MPVTPMFRPIRAVPTSVPFTYRDGITTLELIELLRRNVDILQCDLSKLEGATADLSASVDKALADTVAQINQDMADLRAEMLALIHDGTAGRGDLPGLRDYAAARAGAWRHVR